MMGDSEENNKTPTRMRTKKKSTLTKLKERKLREQGSLTSLQSNHEPEKTKVSSNLPPETSIHGDRVFSTKDPPSSSREAPRPKPRPRGNSLKSLGPSKSDSVEDSGSALQQRLQDLRVTGPYGDSIDSDISSGGFLPKPPLTPRSQSSNPRTPRGYVPAGKGEKRSREHRSSGDEVEVEEKKEKNISTKIEVASLGGVGAINLCEESPRPIHGQVKAPERLLKRRGSRDSTGEAKASPGDARSMSNGVGKPPMYSSHRNTNNNSNHSQGADLPFPPASGADFSIPQSPRGSKYLKASSMSHHDHNSCGDEGAPRKARQPASESSLDRNFRVSSPSQLSENGDLHRAASNHTGASASSVDEGSNKSTQVIYTSESPLKVRSISTPPTTARLDPISPRPNPPPPLTENFSSQNLRTSFKIDPNIRPVTGSGSRGGGGTGDKSDSGGATSNGDHVSQQSFTSGSVLPVITTKEARSRSYLEGSIGNGAPSVLGLEELDRYFPTRRVNVLVGTWNMNEQKDVNYTLNDFVLPERCDYVQDIYAFGTQENDMNKKEWEIKLQETLGPSHVMYHSVSLGSLHLVVFIRRDLIWFCSAPEDDVLSLRAVTMVKTKGAIGISLCLFGTSYLFINCHLTSDRDNDNTRKKNRLGDYFKVIQDMKLPKSSQLLSSTKKTSDITAIFDCVFWCGDLNFRIERKRHAVEGKVSQITEEEFPNFETLLGGDQLLKYMTEGKIFHGFQEGRINFHPTFKFDINKDTYDSSYKSRVPSYTDRIMFRSKRKNDITCMCYDAVMSIKHSDHKPVYGQFETIVHAGTDNMVYSAGHFDRSVYMEANRRRAAKLPVKKKSSSKVCSIQ